MRQEWMVGGFFVVGSVVGGVMTCQVMRNQTNPAALDEETQSKLNAIPFRVALPVYLPHGSESPVVQMDADASGAVRALLAYRTPLGCFGLWESPRDIPDVIGPDAGLVSSRVFGSAWLTMQPEVGSTTLSNGTLRVALVGPSKLGATGCPTSLPANEAKAVLESLWVTPPPPPPLPPLQ